MTVPDDFSYEFDYNWGGDGSDLSQPVRTHVEAALLPGPGSYPAPIDRLLQIGSIHEVPDARSQLTKLGLSEADIPGLVRLARDRTLNTTESDQAEVWAPIYAVLALAQFNVGEHAAELVPLFDLDSEWFGEELPSILAQAGVPALEPLRRYVQDTTRWQYGRWNATAALAALAEQHTELRGQVVETLSTVLEDQRNDPETNGFLLSALLKLKAIEALPAIREAFERDAIDESIAGDWGDVLSALGQPIDRDDPLVLRSRSRRQSGIDAQRALAASRPRERSAGTPIGAPSHPAKPSKRKNKRKMSAASRKANKKKRR